MSTEIFIDCEFTDLDPSGYLISAAFVANDGEIFYAELSDYPASDCNVFVRDTVLPLLSQTTLSTAEFVQQLTGWLSGLGPDVVLIADSMWDERMLRKAFERVGGDVPASWKFRVAPACFECGQQRQAFDEEMSAFFLRHPEETPHHALSDARAVRSAYRRAVVAM